MRKLLQSQRIQGLCLAKASAGRGSFLSGRAVMKARRFDAGPTRPQKARTLKPCVCESIGGVFWTFIGMDRQDLASCQFVLG